MKDIMDMSLPQLEQIMEGISKNNKAQKEGDEDGEEGSAADFINFLKQNNGEL